MTGMSLRALLAGIVPSAPDVMVNGLSLDNRQIRPGMAFVALRGTRQHGLAYAEAAVQAGAVAILYEPEDGLQQPPLSVEFVPVPLLRGHLGTLADRFNSSPSADLFMVGVTGTDGKTSVSHFVAEALNVGSHGAAIIGTLGIGIPAQLQPATHTTPDALTVHGLLRQLRDDGFQTVAMEVSSHALDQGRVNGIRFDVAVLTNLTRDHLDYHGTVEAYAEAKRKLFHWSDLRTVVLNLDDAFGRRLAAEVQGNTVQLIGYGVGSVTDYPVGTLVASDAVFDHTGIRASVVWGQEQGILQAPVLGRFNLHNLLAALGVLLAKGVVFAEALQRLQQVWVVPGRMERVAAGSDDGKLVVVDYAHTPGALEQVLQAVRAHTRGRLLCVFGCGGDRDRGKRPLMAQKAEFAADVVIVTDDNPRSENPQQIFEDIMQGITNKAGVTFEHDRAKAIRLAIQQAQPGDTVLIAGKGHETVQILANGTVPFDDRIQAAQALQECGA
ncbi:MAG TPA: UDP-N-acetylmuramoyl-L-alanyl-D-glutamate--2,6-diaminopimelate ligase [Candidatus Thiothrix moscowensis]|uniref:UDP-N-acetylmuramoyl-L-alanyl-D-glutamate--2, 6-diaminopimelate ligase n=1 Tax=unclassified Thiothrix TaxID=2636184 RepID=UPI0025DACF1A|nr:MULTISPECIES: UDP-N-acetylmuramoyl-L-alanyl-D-glutamate--2,6-diaminopimelate ligase [unclassified Thiothrix]HRJ51662.1 UDP-N-acetylmuramoyl-L-alanyl-D-glutamate--2,6-diaminopimelate ligase [Candidatus Thiothrix moscowensis]HRJ91977.1 UDP-N-acetylmuramoyl-L-alanyl-D-glutamate--2,6-diaminopimelate ligase [Candidatus Thiothrix moscowensis]